MNPTIKSKIEYDAFNNELRLSVQENDENTIRGQYCVNITARRSIHATKEALGRAASIAWANGATQIDMAFSYEDILLAEEPESAPTIN